MCHRQLKKVFHLSIAHICFRKIIKLRKDQDEQQVIILKITNQTRQNIPPNFEDLMERKISSKKEKN